jgi:hypothetical protein
MIPVGVQAPSNPPAGFAPVSQEQTSITASALYQHPAIGGLAFNSDASTNSPAGASNAVIASLVIPAGLLHPNTAPAGLSGNLRRIHVRAYFSGANNVNAKTAGIAFGAAANIVAQCALTVSVAARAVVEADVTVDTGTTQTGQGFGLAATSAVGGTVTGSVFASTALTQNLSVAQSIFFTAVTQTSAADIILTGYQVVIY